MSLVLHHKLVLQIINSTMPNYDRKNITKLHHSITPKSQIEVFIYAYFSMDLMDDAWSIV